MMTTQLNEEHTKDQVHLMRCLSGTWADRWSQEVFLPALASRLNLLTPDATIVRDRLSAPTLCLEVIFGEYAFARRGTSGSELGDIAVSAARSCRFGRAQDVWSCFAELCAERGQKSSEPINRPLIEGLWNLSQELYPCSIASWINEGILGSGRVEKQFMRLTELRGVGPKLASTLLRDLVLLFDIEDRIEFGDRIYLQPVDTWIREFAHLFVSELDQQVPDWVLAGKFARAARKARVSGVRLNCGASYFGSSHVRVPEALTARLNLADG